MQNQVSINRRRALALMGASGTLAISTTASPETGRDSRFEDGAAISRAKAGTGDRSATDDSVAGSLNAEQFGVVVDDGTIDNADALEAWVAAGETLRRRLVWPAEDGMIYSSRPIRLRGNPTYYSLLTGEKHEGPGAGLTLTRKQTRTSKFARLATVGVSVPAGQGVLDRWGKPHINNTASAIVLTGNSSATLLSDGLVVAIQEAIDEAFLVIHGSNYSLDGLRFQQCQIGWLMIADPDEGLGQSHASFNSLTDFRTLDCSIGGIMCADVGCYYNRIEGHHGAQGQFGLILGGSTIAAHNTNRNTFIQNRMARMHVGYAILSGDTNNFFACHTEGCGDVPTGNTYSSPDGLPDNRHSWAWINNGSKQKFTGCIDEASVSVMYSNDSESEFLNCGFHVEDGTDKNLFTATPRVYISEHVVFLGGGVFSILTNQNTNVFGDRRPLPFFDETVRIDGEIRQTLKHGLGNANKVGTVRTLVDAGAVAEGGTYALSLWDSTNSDEDRKQDTAAYFEVTILGDCVASNLAHVTIARIVARRSAVGTLVRWYLLSTEGGRTTGAGAGDGAELFTVALSDMGGALTATLTAPGRTFDGVLIVVEASYARP